MKRCNLCISHVALNMILIHLYFDHKCIFEVTTNTNNQRSRTWSLALCVLCAGGDCACEELQTNDIQSFLAALIPDGIMTSLLRFPTSTSLSSMLLNLLCYISFSFVDFFYMRSQLVCHQASLAAAPSEEEQMGDYDNLGLSPTSL